METTRRQVDSSQEALRLSEANLRAGTMKALDALEAEDTLMRARLRHAEAIVRFNQAQVELLSSLGLPFPSEADASVPLQFPAISR